MTLQLEVFLSKDHGGFNTMKRISTRLILFGLNGRNKSILISWLLMVRTELISPSNFMARWSRTNSLPIKRGFS